MIPKAVYIINSVIQNDKDGINSNIVLVAELFKKKSKTLEFKRI